MPSSVRFVANLDFPLKLGQRKSQVLGALATTYTQIVKGAMENSPRSGRLYGFHRASGPGEPPAPWSRTLIESIGVGNVTENSAAIVISREASAYAKLLEDGTSKMSPRPVWKVSVAALQGARIDIPPASG